eukprot:2716715-Heterocapsa_arctica.AAC.1
MHATVGRPRPPGSAEEDPSGPQHRLPWKTQVCPQGTPWCRHDRKLKPKEEPRMCKTEGY